MKYLTIVRHAKSSWGQPGLADHDRPLNERGKKAAPAVAAFLHRTYFGGSGPSALLPLPDKLVTSTALRALTTAQIMRETFALPVDRSAAPVPALPRRVRPHPRGHAQLRGKLEPRHDLRA
jgi:phosphohistidine phosphatase